MNFPIEKPPHLRLQRVLAAFINTCFFAIIDLMWLGSWSNMIRGEPTWSNKSPKMGQVEFWHFLCIRIKCLYVVRLSDMLQDCLRWINMICFVQYWTILDNIGQYCPKYSKIVQSGNKTASQRWNGITKGCLIVLYDPRFLNVHNSPVVLCHQKAKLA